MAERTDDYVDAVFALLALVNETRFDPTARRLRDDVRFEVGRRLKTSRRNGVSVDTVVTPDCAIQIADDAAIVAEVKIGLPRDRSAWKDDIIQLKKYDDDLSGWWSNTGRIGSHDIAATVPLHRAVPFADLVADASANGGVTFVRNVATIGFRKNSGVKQFMMLKKEGGSLSDLDLGDRLREAVEVPFDRLLVEYGDRKFLDHEPPLPYMLQIIWDCVLTNMARQAPKEPGAKEVQLQVNVEQLTGELQEYYGFSSSGEGSVEIPRATWVRKALDALVSFDLAQRANPGDYVVQYRRPRRDTLEYFGRLCWRRSRRKQAPALPPDAPTIPGLLE